MELPRTRRANRADAACVLVLLLVTVVVYWPALFAGKVLLPADIVPLMPPWSAAAREKFPDLRFAQNQMHGPIFEYYSWRHYGRERILAGEVPLWNPYELGGNVLLANSQSAVLYPPNLLLYVLPLWYGINLVTALHAFLTGLFAFLLLRSLKLGQPAALTGALVWMLCGLQTVWTEFQTPTAVLCWLPAVLWTWQRFRLSGDGRWAVLGAGSAIAMTLLAGHLHFAFYVILAIGLFGLWSAITDGRIVRHLAMLVGALTAGVMLSACTMMPVFEMSRMNFRGAHSDYASSIVLRLPPDNLYTLLLPNLFGNPRDYVALDATGAPTNGHTYWGKFDFIEYTAYLGVPALILLVCGTLDFGFWILQRRRRTLNDHNGTIETSDLNVSATPTNPKSKIQNPKSNAAFFIVLAAIGLLLALGTPLCALFFFGVPGYRQFNATARALCLFSFAGAMLSAFGLQAILDDCANGLKRVWRYTAASVVSVSILGLVAFPGMGLVWQRLFTDQWFTYELANLRHFLLFAAGTAASLWLILRGLQDPSPLTLHPSSLTPHPSPLTIQLPAYLFPALAAMDLLVWGAGFNPMTDPEMLGYPTETTRWLQQQSPSRVVSLETPGRGIKSFIAPNYNAVIHVREAQGADSLHTRRYHNLMESVVRSMNPQIAIPFPDPNTIHYPSVDHPVFDMLNVGYVTAQQQLDPKRFERVLDADLPIWKNPRAFGEAWCVTETERDTGSTEATSRLLDPSFDFHRRAIVTENVSSLDSTSAPAVPVVISFAPHRLEFDVNASGRQLLLSSEIAYPGWRVDIDGHRDEVITANHILRSVVVPRGRHKVSFQFEPASYRIGLFLTCVCLAAFSARCAYRNGAPKPQ